MYIRRKVFSVAVDEYGEERLFSTTDIMSEDEYLKLFSGVEFLTEEQRKIFDSNQNEINRLFDLKRRAGLNKKEEKKLQELLSQNKKLKAGGTDVMRSKYKPGNSTRLDREIYARGKRSDAVARQIREAEEAAAAEVGVGRGAKNSLKSLGNWAARNKKALAIGGAVAGTSALGYGAYKYATRNKK